MRNATRLAFAVLLAPTPLFAGPLPGDGFVVSAGDGTVLRGSGYSVFHIDAGQYEVDTTPDVHSCTYSVTAGSGDTTLPPHSFATAVGRRENHTAIMIATYDGSGQYADMGFHLIVRCKSAAAPAAAAAVASDGTLVRGLGTLSASRTAMGTYTVTFSDVKIATSCAYTASIGSSGTAISDPGSVNVAAGSSGAIQVLTYDAHGEAADRGFHVYVAC
jgi:hypothetical protein